MDYIRFKPYNSFIKFFKNNLFYDKIDYIVGEQEIGFSKKSTDQLLDLAELDESSFPRIV